MASAARRLATQDPLALLYPASPCCTQPRPAFPSQSFPSLPKIASSPSLHGTALSNHLNLTVTPPSPKTYCNYHCAQYCNSTSTVSVTLRHHPLQGLALLVVRLGSSEFPRIIRPLERCWATATTKEVLKIATAASAFPLVMQVRPMPLCAPITEPKGRAAGAGPHRDLEVRASFAAGPRWARYEAVPIRHAE